MHSPQPIARQIEASEFAETHCRQCEAGWTRTLENGAKAVICTLDLQPALTNMTSCDRYMLREDRPPCDPTAKSKAKPQPPSQGWRRRFPRS
jgi:hypothetical protein